MTQETQSNDTSPKPVAANDIVADAKALLADISSGRRLQSKTVTVTTCNRPAYARRTLESLRRCHGVAEYAVTVVVDLGCEETAAIASEYASVGWTIVFPSEKLGCNGAIRAAVDIGFSANDYHIHLEDDTLPSRDCLSWFEWCRQFGNNDRVFSVTAYNTANGLRDGAAVRKWFTPWGWATWADRWAEMRAAWPAGGDVTWDVIQNTQTRRDRYEIHPALSRTQNIGRDNGAHNTPEIWEREQYNEHWAGDDSSTSQWSLT